MKNIRHSQHLYYVHKNIPDKEIINLWKGWFKSCPGRIRSGKN